MHAFFLHLNNSLFYFSCIGHGGTEKHSKYQNTACKTGNLMKFEDRLASVVVVPKALCMRLFLELL